MLPDSFQLPAAIILLAGGLLACFLGYRLFRVVLGIYGFVLGALLATSAIGAAETWTMVLTAIVGGLIGAAILILAYFVGVALIGAGLGVLAVHLVASQLAREPHPLVVIGMAIAGALGALVLQRYVIIVGTAFGGAWTVIVGGLAMAGHERAQTAAAAGDVWVLYPLDAGGDEPWIMAAWIALGLVGMVVQLAVTGRERGKKRR